MTRLTKILIGTGVVAVLGTVVAVSMLSGEKEKGTEVYMADAKERDLLASVTATGSIQPRTKVEVQSSVIGEIVKLPVKDGDHVRKGDLLVQIDPERYRAEVERLEANLRMARIEVEREEASLENSRTTLRRHEQLHKQEILPLETLDKSRLDVRTGEITLNSLKEQVAQAGSSLDKARDELRKTTLISPIEGVVTQVNAELGEMTITGTMNNPGTVIMTVSDLGEILAEVDVDETRVVQVAPGKRARVVVDAVGELHPYEGRVAEIAGTAVKRQGSEVQVFPVKIALDSPDERLRPGMTAKARIETERADHAVTVPIQAVVVKPKKEVAEMLAARADKEKAGKPAADAAVAAEPASHASAPAPGGDRKVEADQSEVVYKVVDGKAVLTPVRTGISDESDVVVLEGLKVGDRLVTGPYRALKKLKDGEAVRKRTDGKDKGKDQGTDEDDSGVQVEVD
ncbi:MAG TPA: efflux RND transporter periplasmic adaptor subunit [Candidatus Polarisedimenticolaceae bacterium]|nr:efflux RND transporter periplasmic adaptor subunit [Candidatus Polarisedimenticolaceae bacterium]